MNKLQIVFQLFIVLLCIRLCFLLFIEMEIFIILYFYFHFVNVIRKIFLEIIPHIGTFDSCLFIRNIITRRKYEVPENVAITMLVKLPSYVKHSTEELLIEMEELLQMKNISEKLVINSVLIKQAAILCFSSLIYKTFMNTKEHNSPLLEMYLQYINSNILGLVNILYINLS
jgi:hypothetical protein